jgi:hypothetical protein
VPPGRGATSTATSGRISRRTREDPAGTPQDLTVLVAHSGRKARDYDSLLRRNVEQWKNHQHVESRRGVFKNLSCNRNGYTINRKEPLKQRGCLLVNRRTLRATLGKRRTVLPDTLELGPQAEDPVTTYSLAISGGKVCLRTHICRPKRAYMKNLAFIQGGKKSSRHVKYVARFISDYGITVRLFRKLLLAATLVMKGKPNQAYALYRSVSNRCGHLRANAEHANYVREPSLSDSSHYSDW